MDFKIKLLFLCANAIILFSCSSNEEEKNIVDRSNNLRITTEIQTRSVIESASFASGDEIGLYLLNTDKKEYKDGYSNITATYNNSWNLNRSVSLTKENAIVYAYYPYSPNASLSSIAIDLTPNETSGQTDYLYGKSEEAVNMDNVEARITFKHALARVTFSIRRAVDDTGSGILSKVQLRNTSGGYQTIANSGTMNITTGVISPTKDKNASITLNTNYILTSSNSQQIDFLIIPTEFSDNYVDLLLTIDNAPYIVKLPAANWKAGQQYTYPITINRNGNSESEKKEAKIGDFYYEDGTWSTQYDKNKQCVGVVFALSDEQDGDIDVKLDQSIHGRVVALHDLISSDADYFAWGPPSEDVEETANFYALDGKCSDGYLPLDGDEYYSSDPIIRYNMYNWPTDKGTGYALTDYTVLRNSFAGDEFPAMAACSHYSTGEISSGWYLPSIGELARLAMACNANLLDVESFSGFESIKYPGYTYWSSSESEKGLEAWCYVAEFGRIYINEKNMKLRVRPIYSF